VSAPTGRRSCYGWCRLIGWQIVCVGEGCHALPRLRITKVVSNSLARWVPHARAEVAGTHRHDWRWWHHFRLPPLTLNIPPRIALFGWLDVSILVMWINSCSTIQFAREVGASRSCRSRRYTLARLAMVAPLSSPGAHAQHPTSHRVGRWSVVVYMGTLKNSS
jgi:hypothetical protein